jgi:hypothetical protein
MLALLFACDVLRFGVGDPATEGDSADSTVDEADYCADKLSVAPPAGPDCVTDTLTCGDVVLATTEGGLSAYIGDNYTSNFCFPNLGRSSYAGPERLYVVELEPEAYAEAVLHAGCAEMGLSALRWPTGGACPTGEETFTVCEGDEGAGTLSVTFGCYPSSNRWLLVIDTAGADSAAFRLALTCAG